MVEKVQRRAGASGVSPAAAYHAARDVFPHNRRRVVYFLEPGVVFFRPSPQLFRSLARQPAVSSLVGDRISSPISSTARSDDLDANAWVVLRHVDRGRTVEPVAQRNAFGDLYPEQLCVSNAAFGLMRGPRSRR